MIGDFKDLEKERKRMEERKEYQEFCKEMQLLVEEKFEPSVCVEIHKVIKNNATELDSMVILDQDKKVSPNFYLNLYYEEYCQGKDMQMLAEQIYSTYTRTIEQEQEPVIDLSFEACEDKITFRLVSYEKNKAMLQTMPYIRFLDMAVVFYLLVRNEADGIGSVRISQRWLDDWQMTAPAVFALARENTRRLFPERICSMHSMLKQLLQEENDEWAMLEETLYSDEQTVQVADPYVITNSNGINGASVILYPDTLKIVGAVFGEDYYLLPSSIHEFLAVPEHAVESVEELYEMVQEANEKFVSQEEFLSGSVYWYECETETIKIKRLNFKVNS